MPNARINEGENAKGQGGNANTNAEMRKIVPKPTRNELQHAGVKCEMPMQNAMRDVINTRHQGRSPPYTPMDAIVIAIWFCTTRRGCHGDRH